MLSKNQHCCYPEKEILHAEDIIIIAGGAKAKIKPRIKT